MHLKHCGKCGEEKSPETFPKNRARKDGLDVYCKPCRSESNRSSYHRHAEKWKPRKLVAAKAWREKNPEYGGSYQRDHYVKLSPDQWAARRAARQLQRDIDAIRTRGVRIKKRSNYRCPIITNERNALKSSQLKRCTKCAQVKPRDQFGADPRLMEGLRSNCTTCDQRKGKQWAERNREKLRAQASERRKKFTPEQRAAQLARTKKGKFLRKTRLANAVSDLTAKQWEVIKRSYGHRCAYCYQKKPLTQDHFIPISKGGHHTASNIVPACRSCNSSKQARILKERPLSYKAIVIGRLF
jgi:5-methylcytosine-specific restriction endonuclease McrA